jgi:hypothetical protein
MSNLKRLRMKLYQVQQERDALLVSLIIERKDGTGVWLATCGDAHWKGFDTKADAERWVLLRAFINKEASHASNP